MVDGIAHFLSATAGDHLRRLVVAFELAWCTGWEEKANEYLPLALGPRRPLALPVVRPGRPGSAAAAGTGSSTAIDAFAAGRPVAWVDDAHGDACTAWAAARGARRCW